MEYGLMHGRYPAIVKSYDQARRTCRIEIPGLTDGYDILPEAEIEYPIGDKSRAGTYTTELEILANDTVWIAFIGGDSRYPIITGYRNPQSDNSVDWRRWHHENMELLANQLMKLISGGDFLIQSSTHVTVVAPLVTVQASNKVRCETPLMEVTGEIKDRCDTSGKTMSGMRATFDSHVHPDPQGGNVAPPSTSM